MNNKSLFWYGWRAKIKTYFGAISIACGLVFGLLFHWFFFIVGVGLGIFLIAKGSSQRFDYKMQSGSIIHKGDW